MSSAHFSRIASMSIVSTAGLILLLLCSSSLPCGLAHFKYGPNNGPKNVPNNGPTKDWFHPQGSDSCDRRVTPSNLTRDGSIKHVTEFQVVPTDAPEPWLKWFNAKNCKEHKSFSSNIDLEHIVDADDSSSRRSSSASHRLSASQATDDISDDIDDDNRSLIPMQLIQSIDAVTFELLKSAIRTKSSSRNRSNVVLSGVGVHQILSMLSAQIKGETLDEILRALGFGSELKTPCRQDLYHYLYQVLLRLLESHTTTKYYSGSVFAMRNDNRPVKEFEVLLQNRYGSIVKVGDLGSSEFIKRCRSELKRQVGKFADVELKETPSKETLFLVAQANYFESEWEKPFKAMPSMRFQVDETKSVSVPAMKTQERHFKYYGDKDVILVQIPYKSNFVMTIAMPSLEKSFEKTSLDPINIAKYLSKMSSCKIASLIMPKFKIDNEHNLIDMLKSMGINRLFDGAEDDLEEMFQKKDWSAKSGVVGQAIQNAAINVDHKGTVAKSYTSMDGRFRSLTMGRDIRIDRPFLFRVSRVIEHGEDVVDVPLFSGAVFNPIEP